MNEKNETRSKDDVWQLTEQWIAKVNAAYDGYKTSTKAYHQNLLVMLFGVFGLVLAIMIPSALQVESAIGRVVSALFVVIFIIVFIAGVVESLQTHRNVRSARNDLADIYAIANELMQMVISTEEKFAGSRYEYLVNHIRIIEVKQLLEKVKRTARV